MSRGNINMTATTKTRLPNESRDVDVAVVLALAAIARKQRGKQRKREALPPQSDAYSHLIANFFFRFSFFPVRVSSKIKVRQSDAIIN